MYKKPRSDRESDCEFTYFKNHYKIFGKNMDNPYPIPQFAPGNFLYLNENRLYAIWYVSADKQAFI